MTTRCYTSSLCFERYGMPKTHAMNPIHRMQVRPPAATMHLVPVFSPGARKQERPKKQSSSSN
jgi:hypothetical protein